MRDLSLHLMDIIQNSITAKAGKVITTIGAIKEKDMLYVSISDNGVGMDRKFLNQIADPFVTTRKTRKVGLGISLLKASAQRSSGDMNIESAKGIGTTVNVSFKMSHIDRPPLGDVADTFTALISANPGIELELKLDNERNQFIFRTEDIRQKLGEVPIAHYEVLSWIREFINEGINNTFGGVLDEIIG